MERKEFFRSLSTLFEKESRLIELLAPGKVIFVGDTHGDLDATEKVLSRFLEGTNRIVFLGDYVDRGRFSKKNIDTLLRVKRNHPKKIFLLAGNHEGYLAKPFSPSNFWDSLSRSERELYGRLFETFPLAMTSSNGILALHGGLPDLATLEDIRQIEWGDAQWDRITWGDFVEREGEFLEDLFGRLQFGRDYFERLMQRYQKRVLVRSHQPYAPLFMFEKRCLTLFTSNAYIPDRHVAVVDLENEVRTVEDLVLEAI